MSELFLVRHAQASFGSSNYDQLSEIGMRQSEWLGGYFDSLRIHFDRLICGDMERHRQTLFGICNRMNLKVDDRIELCELNEYDFSDLILAFSNQFPENPRLLEVQADSSSKEKHYRLLRDVLSAWGRNEIAEVGETWHVFSDRVFAARKQIQAIAKTGEKVLAIGSGGSNSTFMGQVLKTPIETIFDLNLQSKNTGINRYFYNQSKISLVGFNGTPHLEMPERFQYITYA
ncbi:MAG: phosphoglycerate mutase [Porticoccaceae bacterium]|nr:phosphoglycerate mutase [Porticoccaceae bacterium]